MYQIIYKNSFKKDLKRCKKRGYNISLFADVIGTLSKTGKLPAHYQLHKLTGKFKDRWECHYQTRLVTDLEAG